MNKLELLKKELKGLDVDWQEHFSSKGITMAKVKGSSIVWHEYAYSDPDEPTVEVWFKWEDDVDGHVPIKGLRERIIKADE